MDRGLVSADCRPQSAQTTINLAVAAPKISRQPADATVAQGQVATFSVAARGSGPFSYQWQQSIDAGLNWFDLPATANSYTTGPTTSADDGALFRVSVRNSEGDATSDLARLAVNVMAEGSSCPMPPRDVAFVRDAPAPVAPGIAAYGTNLLLNADFEEPVYVGFAPADFGYWRFDEAVSVPAQQDIAPRLGSRMLHLVGTSRDTTQFGSATASEQAQLIDVSALAADIDAGRVQAHALAWFARVQGCAQTDDAFSVQIIAFNGAAATFGTRWSNGINASIAQGVSREAADMTGVDGWLQGGYANATVRHNAPADQVGNIFGWRQAQTTLDLPPGTRFVAVLVLASENVRNDPAFPELHGHYADDVELVLTPKP